MQLAIKDILPTYMFIIETNNLFFCWKIAEYIRDSEDKKYVLVHTPWTNSSKRIFLKHNLIMNLFILFVIAAEYLIPCMGVLSIMKSLVDFVCKARISF